MSKQVLKLAPRNYNNLSNLDQYVNYGYDKLNPEILMHGMPRGEKDSDIPVYDVLASRGFHLRPDGHFYYLSHDHNEFEAFGTGLEDVIRSYIDTFSDQLGFAASVKYAADILDEYYRTSEDLVAGYLESREKEIEVEAVLFGENTEVDVDNAELILEASRVYRSDKGNTVNVASKMSQSENFGDGDVAFKFEDFKPTAPVVMAGCGDDIGRTHYPFKDKVVDMLDPNYDGSLLTTDYDLKGKSLASDIADADKLGLDMTERTNHMYKYLHDKFPDSEMCLKVDIFHLPDLGMRVLKKPRPHNAEVIVVVDDDSDNSWVNPMKASIIRANWLRNTNIRRGIYNIPKFSGEREQYLRKSAHLDRKVKGRHEAPMKKRTFDRGLVRCSEYQRRLRCVAAPRISAIALGPCLFFHSQLTSHSMNGVIDLDDYQLYYSHVSATRAVDAIDACLVKLDLTRKCNLVNVPMERLQEFITRSFDLLVLINDHSA